MSLMIDEVHKLLSIAELSGKWPHLRPVHDAAMRALAKHAEGAAKDNAAALKAEQDAAAKAKADALEQAKAQAAKDEEKPEPEPDPDPAPFKRRFGSDDTAEERKE